jgi:hypothetical protein
VIAQVDPNVVLNAVTMAMVAVAGFFTYLARRQLKPNGVMKRRKMNVSDAVAEIDQRLNQLMKESEPWRDDVLQALERIERHLEYERRGRGES